MAFLTVDGVQKSFDKNVTVLKGISAHIEKGEIAALVGESGCGKTTLLRTIAGFEKADSGSILLDNLELQSHQSFMAPEKRNIGFLFQDYALFPHMTVAKNIAFGLSKLPVSERDKRIDSILTMLGIEALKQRFPHEISGGQQQRVALARALAPSPQLLLMDEPFSNIDNMIKDQVRVELKEVLKKSNTTSILVTHDMEDAMVMADKIFVMQDGKILQADSPQDIYQKPVDKYVAGFFGKANWFSISESNTGQFDAFFNGHSFSDFGDLLIRPEDITTHPSGADARIKKIAFRGSYQEVTVEMNGQNLSFTTQEFYEIGQSVKLLLRKEGNFKIY